jgi:hypothetical protein
VSDRDVRLLANQLCGPGRVESPSKVSNGTYMVRVLHFWDSVHSYRYVAAFTLDEAGRWCWTETYRYGNSQVVVIPECGVEHAFRMRHRPVLSSELVMSVAGVRSYSTYVGARAAARVGIARHRRLG